MVSLSKGARYADRPLRRRTVTELTAEDIRAWRGAADLSQSELAELVGVSLRSIVNWETGASKPQPRMEFLLRNALRKYPEPKQVNTQYQTGFTDGYNQAVSDMHQWAASQKVEDRDRTRR